MDLRWTFRREGSRICILGLAVRDRDRLFRSSDRQTDIRITALFSAVGLRARVESHGSDRQLNPIFFMSVPPLGSPSLAALDRQKDRERC